MSRKLTGRSSLDNLRKEAKRWLKAMHARDPQALARLRRVHPDAPADPGLRDVQQALAREYGAEGWTALKAALAQAALDGSTQEELLTEFLEHARLRYGVRPGTSKWSERYYDDERRWRYAARILDRHPRIVRGSIHAACVSGDLAEVERILKSHPAAAFERAQLDEQQPLEYLCYGRLPIAAASENATAIAVALLDAGASCQHALPDDDGAHFQPLTGVIGAGEAGQPPHPQAQELAALLIERGADPYDAQALYNTALGADDPAWLHFLFTRSEQRGETRKWTQASSRWPKIPIVDFLLIMAVHGNQITRAQWALAHGANPRCRHPYYAPRNLHTDALISGFTQVADLLLQCGGAADPLSGSQAFQVACVRLNRDEAAKLAGAHPEYLANPGPMHVAASADLKEVAELLLDLGTSPNVANATNFRPLHAAASHDSAKVGALLIERGAAIDPLETRFNGTPLSWAIYHNRPKMMRLLGTVSRNLPALCRMGNVARLRELFADNPELAGSTHGHPSAFFALPDDEDAALEIVEMLLANGADPRIVSEDGTTTVVHARKQGLDAVADLLELSLRGSGMLA
jgi:hypothetical protein